MLAAYWRLFLLFLFLFFCPFHLLWWYVVDMNCKFGVIKNFVISLRCWALRWRFIWFYQTRWIKFLVVWGSIWFNPFALIITKHSICSDSIVNHQFFLFRKNGVCPDNFSCLLLLDWFWLIYAHWRDRLGKALNYIFNLLICQFDLMCLRNDFLKVWQQFKVTCVLLVFECFEILIYVTKVQLKQVMLH